MPFSKGKKTKNSRWPGKRKRRLLHRAIFHFDSPSRFSPSTFFYRVCQCPWGLQEIGKLIRTPLTPEKKQKRDEGKQAKASAIGERFKTDPPPPPPDRVSRSPHSITQGEPLQFVTQRRARPIWAICSSAFPLPHAIPAVFSNDILIYERAWMSAGLSRCSLSVVPCCVCVCSECRWRWWCAHAKRSLTSDGGGGGGGAWVPCYFLKFSPSHVRYLLITQISCRYKTQMACDVARSVRKSLVPSSDLFFLIYSQFFYNNFFRIKKKI